MQTNFVIIKTKKKNALSSVTCSLEIGGKYSETISEEIADNLISIFGLKKADEWETTKLTNNEGFFDYLYQ